MSIKLDVYPRILIPPKGLRIKVQNPTNADQDITVHFLKDTTALFDIVFTGVKSGESKDVVISKDDFDLSAYAGANLVAYPEIPTPAEGVVLLGTSQAPEVKGNAVPLRVASTVTISCIDEQGRSIPFPDAVLFNRITGELYHFKGDSDGNVKIPERTTDNEVGWDLELFKADYSLRLFYYALIKDFDFTSRTVTLQAYPRLQVELGFHAPPDETQFQNYLKNMKEYLPSPLKTVVENMIASYGLTSTKVVNIIWAYTVSILDRDYGVRAFCTWYENNQLKVRALVGFSSPIAPAVIALIIAGLVTGGAVAWQYLEWQKVSKQAEIQDSITKREQIRREIIDEIIKQFNEGKIDSTTKDNALSIIKEIFDEQSSNTPADWLTWLPNIIPVIIALVVIVLIVQLVRAIRG
ncbi:MAG: hypothetical protein ACXQTI_08800 [Candidatus Nezhaarchaeales archaeon]